MALSLYRPPAPPAPRYRAPARLPRLLPQEHGLRGTYGVPAPPPRLSAPAPRSPFRPPNWNTGVSSVAGPPPPPAPPTYLTDAQIQAQAQAQAKAIYDPMLQQLVDMINRRGQEGAAAIAALTGEYAKAAQGYASEIPGIYGAAESQTATASQALADRLKGQGSSLGQDLAAALEQAGQKGPGDINLPQEGTGAGNAAYGTGIAELDALIARAASASTVAAGEPARAFAGGQQTLGGFQRYLAGLLAEKTGALTAQEPQTAQGIAQGLFAERTGKQQADEQTRQFNVQQAQHQQEVAAAQAANAAARAENQRRYNTQQAQIKTQNRQTLLNNFEVRTGYRGVLTPTGVTYMRIHGQRVPTQGTQTRAYNIRQNRIAQKQQTAATLTGQKGYLYHIDAKGRVRPVDVKPKVPGLQPSWTQSGEANRQSVINAKVARITALGTIQDPVTGKITYTPTARAQIKKLTGIDPGAGPPVSATAASAAARNKQAAVREAHRHQEAVAKINESAATIDERIRHNKAVEGNDKASVAARAAATQARVADEKRRAALTAASQAERARHNRATEGATVSGARQKAVKARGDAWGQARQGIYSDAKAIINAHPGLHEGTPAWKQGYATLLRKYRADVLRYTDPAGRKGALRQLDAWIRAALGQPGTREPARSGSGGSGASGVPKSPIP